MTTTNSSLPSYLSPLKFDPDPLTYIINTIEQSGYDRILRSLVHQSTSDGWKSEDFDRLLYPLPKSIVRNIIHALLQLDKLAVYCRKRHGGNNRQFRYFLHNPINDEPESFSDWEEIVIYNQE